MSLDHFSIPCQVKKLKISKNIHFLILYHISKYFLYYSLVFIFLFFFFMSLDHFSIPCQVKKLKISKNIHFLILYHISKYFLYYSLVFIFLFFLLSFLSLYCLLVVNFLIYKWYFHLHLHKSHSIYIVVLYLLHIDIQILCLDSSLINPIPFI